MGTVFNFINGPVSNLNFYFGQSEICNFNFTEAGYSPDSNFNFGVNVRIFNILMGESNNFISVWVYNNKMFIGSNNCLNIVDLESNSVVDFYTTTYGGEANEELDTENILDINVTNRGA